MVTVFGFPLSVVLQRSSSWLPSSSEGSARSTSLLWHQSVLDVLDVLCVACTGSSPERHLLQRLREPCGLLPGGIQHFAAFFQVCEYAVCFEKLGLAAICFTHPGSYLLPGPRVLRSRYWHGSFRCWQLRHFGTAPSHRAFRALHWRQA